MCVLHVIVKAHQVTVKSGQFAAVQTFSNVLRIHLKSLRHRRIIVNYELVGSNGGKAGLLIHTHDHYTPSREIKRHVGH